MRDFLAILFTIFVVVLISLAMWRRKI